MKKFKEQTSKSEIQSDIKTLNAQMHQKAVEEIAGFKDSD